MAIYHQRYATLVVASGVGSSNTWAEIRGLTGGVTYEWINPIAGTSSSNPVSEEVFYSIGVGNWYGLSRTYVNWDTSFLTAGATVNSARVDIYVSSLGGSDTSPGNLVIASQSGTTAATSSTAWTELGASRGQVAFTSLSSGSYKNISISASAINKTGTTRLILLSSKDFNNTEPVGELDLQINGTVSPAYVYLYIDYTPPAQTVTMASVLDMPFTVIASPEAKIVQTPSVLDLTFEAITPTVTGTNYPNTLTGTPGPIPASFDIVSGTVVENSLVPDIKFPVIARPSVLYASISDEGKTFTMKVMSKGSEPIDLTSAQSVTVDIYDEDDTLTVSYSTTEVSHTDGTFKFTYNGSDFSEGGSYYVETNIDWGGSFTTLVPATKGRNLLLVTSLI